MTSPNVRKVFGNRSNKNCTYSHTIQMESPPNQVQKLHPLNLHIYLRGYI